MASILITGGTGTIGQALVRSALTKYERVCVYSRDEFKQAVMAEQIEDMEKKVRWFIGDVRDQERLRRALEGVDDVIHAAALKRVEVGEYNPSEFVKTNVLGTLNLIEAAHDAKVKRVVGLSTDKALDPQNTYGATKLLFEKLLVAANNTRGDYGPMFSVTRFGNVIGSRGSVLDIWKRMIASGASSLPVTDRNCTRYWLSKRDACVIVWQALHIMPVEPLIPRLPAFLVTDLAESLQMPWHEVGLRPGESLHEKMGRNDSSETAERLTVQQLADLCHSLDS